MLEFAVSLPPGRVIYCIIWLVDWVNQWLTVESTKKSEKSAKKHVFYHALANKQFLDIGLLIYLKTHV